MLQCLLPSEVVRWEMGVKEKTRTTDIQEALTKVSSRLIEKGRE